MITCIVQVNHVLEFIINVAIIIGVCFLIYFYCRLRFIESKIEAAYKNFERSRDGLGGEGVKTEIRNRQIDRLEEDRKKCVDPLERERQRIISKIPFVK